MLFWDKENRNDHVSSRLINLLRLQADSERLSKEKKRKRLNSSVARANSKPKPQQKTTDPFNVSQEPTVERGDGVK